MKKFAKIITAAVVLLCGMLLTGCGAADNIKEALSGPKDTWFRKEITYKTGSGADEKSTELVVFMLYSEDGYTSTELRSDVTVGPGLTLVVIPSGEVSDNSVIQGLTTGKYLIKTFSNTEETEVEGGTDDGTSNTATKIKMTSTKWNLIYNSVDNLEKLTGVITPLHNDNKSVWHELTKPDTFSWKKIMANYMLDQLLDE